MIYSEKELLDKEFVIIELESLNDLKEELCKRMNSYYSPLSVPEKMYNQLDYINECLNELKEALGEKE